MTNTLKREINGWKSRAISHQCVEQLILRYLDKQGKRIVWATAKEIADYFNLEGPHDRQTIGMFLKKNYGYIFKGGAFRVSDRRVTWEPEKVCRYQIIRRQ